MSRIFDAVRKHNIIDFGEICEADLVSREQPADRKAATPISGPVSPSRALSHIVLLTASDLPPLFPFDKQHHAAAEQYRIIRTKILHRPTKPSLIVISSASSGDGKTVTSINIAASLALKEEARVLLIDGDLHHPRISEAVGIPNSPGLRDVLTGEVGLDSALVRTEQFPNLFVLAAGKPTENTAELLDGPRWHALLDQVRARFSNVIVDAPPIATVADYELLQLACDGLIIVARPDHSDRAALFKALQAVPKERLLGVVLNCVEEWWFWKTPGYGYYRKSIPESDKDRRK
jgi:protein-tyrosine kinase